MHAPTPWRHRPNASPSTRWGAGRRPTTEQPQLQVDALQRAGCYWVFTETASGACADRPVFEQVLDQLRPGDTVVVWK